MKNELIYKRLISINRWLLIDHLVEDVRLVVIDYWLPELWTSEKLPAEKKVLIQQIAYNMTNLRRDC